MGIRAKKAHFFSAVHESEREKESVEREAPTSLYDLRRSGGRLSTGLDLKLEYSARATCGYQKVQVSPRFHA